jgi:hypothetical protein
MADHENSSEPKVSAEIVKDKKKTKTKVETEGVFLPVLIEFTFTFSAIVLILLFLTVVSICLLTGATLLDIVIRTSVTMLVIGGLLILISRQISSDVLTASLVLEEEQVLPSSENFEGIEEFSPSEVQ